MQQLKEKKVIDGKIGSPHDNLLGGFEPTFRDWSLDYPLVTTGALPIGALPIGALPIGALPTTGVGGGG